MLPDPLDVLAATLPPGARTARIDGARVVRTPERDDEARGNAVHHETPVARAALPAALADLDRRFPTGRARIVAPWHDQLVDAVPPSHTAERLAVLLRAAAPATSSSTPPAGVTLAPPTDDRAWHGVTVLHRHAGAPGEDRSRGGEDARLRWWVDQLQVLVEQGRARVLRAERFGTPVGVGVLHWEPGTAVDEAHAGLAVVAGVVVHPAHRSLGIGRALVESLVTAHLQDFPRARVAALVASGPARPVPAPDGWRRHAELLAVTRPWA